MYFEKSNWVETKLLIGYINYFYREKNHHYTAYSPFIAFVDGCCW